VKKMDSTIDPNNQLHLYDMLSNRLMDHTHQFCSNCGSNEKNLIYVNDNCLYSHLGDYICKDCCETCDWIGSCVTFETW